MVIKRKQREQEGESPLKQLRDELDLSQEQFGKAIGITARTVSRWESGDTIPTFTIAQMKSLERLLRLANKSIQELPDDFAAPKRSPSVKDK